MKPEDYIDGQGKPFEQSGWQGYAVLEVLQFLYGKPWDDVAIAYIHALRPSRVRVLTEKEPWQTMDCMAWRVSVYLNVHDRIRKIVQETRVGLSPEFRSSDALKDALEFGRDSEQVAWHNMPADYISHSLDGKFKSVNGERIFYPKPKVNIPQVRQCKHLEFIRPVDNFFYMTLCHKFSRECIDSAEFKCPDKELA